MSAAEFSLRHHPDTIDDTVESTFASHGCCCTSNWWQPTDDTGHGNDDSWWFRGWKKIREWSEIVCGPKWKTFIRQFGKNRVGGKGGGKFQYDPLSYALNFDDGPEKTGLADENSLIRNFSYRYASIPASAYNSVELWRSGPILVGTA